MDNKVKFDLTELPDNEFVVLLKPKIQKKLILDSANKITGGTKDWGKYKKLAIYLHKKCKSFEDIKINCLWDNFLSDWKNSRKYIPLDCVFELCRLINKNLEEKDVLFVKYKFSHNKDGIKFPFDYNKNLAFLGEAIRMEGHIKKDLRQINISNQNLFFLKKIERIVKNYIPRKSIYKNLSVEADIPKNRKILAVKEDGRRLNFNVYKASRSEKLKLRFYDKADKLTKKYSIILSDSSKIYVNIKEVHGELISESNYKVASTVLSLTVCNKTFTMLLNILLKIPKGKKSDIIFVPDILKNSPSDVKIEAINAILDSEAWIDNNRIRIGINSKEYLNDLKNLLKILGIEASLENKNSILSINSVKELIKIKEYFKFSSKRKNKRLERISKKRVCLKWGEGTKLILKILKENGRLTNQQISDYRNKHKDTIHKQLLECIKEKLVKRDINVWPYKYYITQKGLNNLDYGDRL